MKRTFTAILLLLFLTLPATPLLSQESSKEYKIETMDQNNGWVMVEKRQRMGGGSTVYYLRKDKIISIELDYPTEVTIMMEEKVEYKMEFISNIVASQFVRDLVTNL